MKESLKKAVEADCLQMAYSNIACAGQSQKHELY